MAKCLVQGVDNYLRPSNQALDGCQFITLSSDEYSALIAVNEDSTQLHISQSLYGTVTGFLLLSFVSGHALGRIVKTFGKH